MAINRIEQLHIMIKNSPQDRFLHYALGLEHLKQANFKDAKQSFETVLKIDNNYLPVYYQLGKLYETLEAINDAKNIYTKGIALAEQQVATRTKNELQSALDLLAL